MWGDGMIVVLNDRQFGKNLRFLRRRHRYSRWELANLICSYPKVIRDWETGRSFDVDAVCLQNIILFLNKTFQIIAVI